MNRRNVRTTSRKRSDKRAEQAAGAVTASADAAGPTTVAPSQPSPPSRRDEWLLAAAVTLELAWITLLIILAARS